MSFSRRRTWLILGVYAILTAVITWPTLANLGTHIPGSEGDAFNHLWTFHWIKTSLLSGQNPFYTTQLYYPNGVSLLFHNIAWLHIAIWLPLQAIVGAAPAYSLIFMGNFAVNAFAFYLFAREESGSETAAFVGGLVCGFWPYALSHHNHPNLILIGWIPLAMLHLRRLIKNSHKPDFPTTALASEENSLPSPAKVSVKTDHRQKGSIFWTAVFLALIGLTRWQLLIMSILPLGSYLLYQLGQQRLTRPIIARLAATGLIAAVLMTPLAIPVLQAQFSRDHPDDLFVDESPSQTDLLAYFVPNRYHPLWGQTVSRLFYNNFEVNKTFTPSLGYTVMLLILVAAATRWRKAWFWLLLSGLNILLALGPTLRFNGNFYGPLPYRWLQDFFLVEIIRHPDRLNVVLAVPIAMCVVWAITAVPPRILPWLASLLLITESLMAYPQYSLNVPVWYQQIAQEPGRFAILDLPMNSRSYDKEYMFYQLTHGKPLIGGHVSRLPREALAFINGVPLLNQAQDNNAAPKKLINVSQQMALLAQANIPYFVLHKNLLSHEQELTWQDWLILPPFFEDETLLVYETAAFQQPPTITEPLLTDEQGNIELGLIQAAVSPQTIAQTGNVQLALSWGSQQPPSNDLTICFELQNDSDTIPLAPCQPFAPEWPVAQWQANEWLHTAPNFPLSPYLPAGDYAVVARIVGGETAVLGSITYNAQPRQFTAPTPPNSTDLIWPNAFSLIGYDAASQGETITLTLYWQAQQRLDTSYKFFVHALDPQTNTVVSQIDAIPRDWTYPTDWWEAQEYITDSVTLTVPPGTYDLLVGWYEPETSLRLPLETAAGTPYPDQIAPLTTLTIPDQ